MVRRPAEPERTDEDAIPRFLWDRSITRATLREILANPADGRRLHLLATLLREARPDEVWAWITPQAVAAELDTLGPLLGRRRAFWIWLFDGWRSLGLLP